MRKVLSQSQVRMSSDLGSDNNQDELLVESDHEEEKVPYPQNQRNYQNRGLSDDNTLYQNGNNQL